MNLENSLELHPLTEGQNSHGLPDLQPKLDEVKAFSNIIPDELEMELKKAVKTGDLENAKNIIDTKIQPIIDNYMAKLRGPPLEGEQILWQHVVTKGIFNKEILEVWRITDFRAFLGVPKTKTYFALNVAVDLTVTGVGLVVCDTVVMNQHRKSSGSRVGTFTGVAGGGFVGTGVSSSESTSSTYGDLVFFSNGKEVFRFRSISDPHGVRRLIETIKKQTKV